MNYYLDTEFHEDGKTIDLISIALVCEDGRELYLINREAELHRVNSWVRENVLPKLPPYSDPRWVTRGRILRDVNAFVLKEPKPIFWGYFAGYDWVVLCQLFGTMVMLPSHFPMFCMDLKQLSVTNGNPELPKQEGEEHDALADARWNLKVHRFLDGPGRR